MLITSAEPSQPALLAIHRAGRRLLQRLVDNNVDANLLVLAHAEVIERGQGQNQGYAAARHNVSLDRRADGMERILDARLLCSMLTANENISWLLVRRVSCGNKGARGRPDGDLPRLPRTFDNG
ncbi:MAG: hypothetical protein ACLQF1_05705 [Methyloceanibacter sp.]